MLLLSQVLCDCIDSVTDDSSITVQRSASAPCALFSADALSYIPQLQLVESDTTHLQLAT